MELVDVELAAELVAAAADVVAEANAEVDMDQGWWRWWTS